MHSVKKVFSSRLPFLALKALVLASLPQRFYQLRRFDSTELRARSSAALQTYRYQVTLHGWPLNSVGLPQCAVDVALLIFLQDTFLSLFEQGEPVPAIVAIVTIWTKGLQKVNILTELVLGLPNLAVPIIVRSLEDVECSPAATLLAETPLADTPASMVTKALCFPEWLDENQLG